MWCSAAKLLSGVRSGSCASSIGQAEKLLGVIHFYCHEFGVFISTSYAHERVRAHRADRLIPFKLFSITKFLHRLKYQGYKGEVNNEQAKRDGRQDSKKIMLLDLLPYPLNNPYDSSATQICSVSPLPAYQA